MQTEYKGVKITVRDEDFYVDEIGAKPTLKAMRAAIDAYQKGERALRVPAYHVYRGWRGEKYTITKVTVTSLAENRFNRDSPDEAWVVDEKKSRSKVSIKSLYPATDAAKAAIDEMARLQEEVNTAEKALNKHIDSMPTFTADSLKAQAREVGENERK